MRRANIRVVTYLKVLRKNKHNTKRNEFVNRKMVAATVEQNIEDHISDIMDDIVNTKTKL